MFYRKDSLPQKTDVLFTNLSGRFAINICDDLIIVHHQTSKSSLVFDINLSPNEICQNVKCHLPIISKCVIKPYKINNIVDYELCKWQLWRLFVSLQWNDIIRLLDSSNWVIFQPNIIIDAKYGCLWLLQLNLESVFELIKNVPILIDFLILRKNSKPIILKVCRNVVRISEKYCQNPIGNISLLFNKLNLAYKESLNEAQASHHPDNFDYLKHKILVTIDQKDILSHFFEFFEEDQVMDRRRVIGHYR